MIEELRTLTEVAKASGISYRQADYWVRQGWIEPLIFGGKGHAERRATSQSGNQRRLPEPEARVLELMARMALAGIDPSKAAGAARELAYKRRAICSLGYGVHVLVVDKEAG